MPRRWLPILLAGIVGLLPLLYLPLRAASGARGATADLATWPGFLNPVLATGFRGDFFYFIEPAIFWERLKIMGNVLTFQFDYWLLAGMVIGGLTLVWRDRMLALLLAGSFLLHTLITATYRAPQTVEYMLPAYVAAVLGLGGVAHLRHSRYSLLFYVIVALLLIAAVNQGLRRFPSFDHLHYDNSTREFAQTLLREAPPDSVILAHWQWATPLWYLQEVEQQRPDVESRYVFPEGESYPDTWARRTAEAYRTGRPVIATYYDAQRFTDLPTPRPLGNAFLFPVEPLTRLPPEFTAVDVR
jgi:hypothetical protein